MAKRTKIYVCKVPGGKLYHMVVHHRDRAEPDVESFQDTQKATLAEAKREVPPYTINMQGKDGKWREVYSDPPIRNKDERK